MTLDLSHIPVLSSLAAPEALAERISLAAGDTLFQEGASPEYAYLRLSGRCMLSRDARPLGEARSDALLDGLAVLGGLPHTQRAIALTDCEFLRWSMARLWQQDGFAAAARRFLAQELQHSQQRLHALEAPIHYLSRSAQLAPGPFTFDQSTVLFLFCQAATAKIVLPEGVSRVGDSLLVAIADFRNATYDHRPDARFGYTETTFFLPVRVGHRLGLYVPLIYPSSYEPILLGREIYGFPKQLGNTTLGAQGATLDAQGDALLQVTWQSQEPSREARIVGAMGHCYGAPSQLTAAAFAVGDGLLSVTRLPFHRHINVFNHKRIPSVTSKHGALQYDVDQLTQAVFTVVRWHHIDRLHGADLHTTGAVLREWDISLRDAYHTQVDMRLSTGRVLRDYRRA